MHLEKPHYFAQPWLKVEYSHISPKASSKATSPPNNYMYFIIYLTEEVLKGTVIAVIQGSSFDREVETEFSSLEVGNLMQPN